jgi:hypothetical protein
MSSRTVVREKEVVIQMKMLILQAFREVRVWKMGVER